MIAGRDEAWTTSRQMIILPGDDESSYHRDDSRDALTVDEMLSLHVGGVGRAQVRHFMLASVAWVPAAFLTLMSVFTERNPAWRCTSISPDGCGDNDICDLRDDEWEWVSKPASIVSEWNLICDEQWKVSASDSMFFLGFFFGAGMFGQLSDISGRRTGMYTSLCVGGFGAAISAATFDFWEYFFARFIIGFGVGGIGVSSFVLSTEPLGVDWRGVFGIATQYWWAVGICLNSGLAALVTEWRALTFLNVALKLAYCLGSAPFLHESPRWLLIAGKQDKALKVLTAMAKGNGQEIPADGLPPLKQSSSTSGGSTVSIRALFPYPVLRLRLFAMSFIFVANSMVYYGLSLNVGALGGSIYWNNFLSGLVDMSSYAFAQVFVDVVGRNRTLKFCLGLAGVGCLVSGFATGAAKTGVALTGRFGIAASFDIIFLYTAELFPTVVRSAAVGICSTVARLGGIAAPQIILLQSITPSFPFLIFGSTAIAAYFTATLLPETKGVVLAETLAGAARQAEMGANTRFYQLDAGDFEEDEETLPQGSQQNEHI